jgi:hypothetical protein
MTEEAVKRTKKQPRRDRVNLDPVAVTRLDDWIAEVQAHLKGVKINRSDLVNFLISQHPEGLSSIEVQSLKKTFFDEAGFAEWALREFRKAKERGENPSLSDILKPVLSTTSVKRRKIKSNETESISSDPA